MQQTTRWGLLPKSGAYRLASGQIDPQTVAQVKQCLTDIGLHQSIKPRYFVELAHTLAPSRVVADGMTHDEPPPLVVAGKMRDRRADQEALTLVLTDFSDDKDKYRVRLTERIPKNHISNEPAIGAALCTFIKKDQSSSN